MTTFYFNAVFNKDVVLKNAWGYGNNASFFSGEKTKCMITDNGIMFCRLNERGREEYSFAYPISNIAEIVTLEVIN